EQRASARDSDVEHGHDARMIELSSDLRLASKARHRTLVDHASEHLQRQSPPVGEAFNFVHLSHPAPAKQAHNTIAVVDNITGCDPHRAAWCCRDSSKRLG